MEFEVFRTGIHTDSQGRTREFTEGDLDFIASSYNPKLNESPLVIGHPKINAPAYGWIGSLKRSGQTLFASASTIVPEFLEALKQGLFKKRSIALNSDGTLRHVGFLGAVPPAVKGLKDLEFTDTDSENYEFISNENEIKSLSDLSLTNTLNYNSQCPKVCLEESGSASTNDNSSAASSFSEQDQIRQKILNEIELLYLKQRKTEFEIYLNEKLAYGSITPSIKNRLLKLLEALSGSTFSHTDNNYTFTFSDSTIEDPLELLKEVVDSLPKIITFEEVALQPNTGSLIGDDSFAGFSLDTQALEFHEKIKHLSAAENISYSQALNKLKAAN